MLLHRLAWADPRGGLVLCLLLRAAHAARPSRARPPRKPKVARLVKYHGLKSPARDRGTLTSSFSGLASAPRASVVFSVATSASLCS